MATITKKRVRASSSKMARTDAPSNATKEAAGTKRSDHLKGAMALGIVAVLLGLTIGGYIASRYFEPTQARQEVSSDLVEQLAAQLAQDIVGDREAQELQGRAGRVETVEAVLSDTVEEATGELPPSSQKRYVNEYFGMGFVFPNEWAYTERVELNDAQTILGDFSSDAIDLSLSVIDTPRLGFRGFVQDQFTTQEDADTWIQETIREYAELFPDQEPLVIATVPFEHGALRVGGHDARVDVVTPPVLPGEPVRTIRRFWLNAGRGVVVAMRFASPAFVPTDEQPNDPYAAVIQKIVESVTFFDDGVEDAEGWSLPEAQAPEGEAPVES